MKWIINKKRYTSWRIGIMLLLMMITVLDIPIQYLVSAGAAVPDKTAPSIPSGLTVSATGQKSVTLRWTPSKDNVKVTAYLLLVNGKQSATAAAANYTLTGLTPATAYKIVILAKDAAGNYSKPSNPLWVKTDGGNIIANGGFELDANADGRADGWTYEGGVISLIGQPVKEGKRSLRFVGDRMAFGKTVSAYQRIAVQGGKSYVYEGDIFIKRLAGAKLSLFVDFFDSSGRWVGDNSRSLTGTASSFTAIKAEGTVPDKAAYAFVVVRITATAANASSLVVADNIRLRYTELQKTDRNEPDNTMAEALPVRTGVYSSYLSKQGDEDWFRYEAEGKQTVRISLDVPEMIDAELEVRTASGRILAASKHGRGEDEEAAVQAEAGQIIYLRIYGARSEDYGIDPYTLKIDASAVEQEEQPAESADSGAVTIEGVDIQGNGDQFTSGDTTDQLTLWAVQTNERLYMMVRSVKLPASHRFYLNTDGSSTTGYTNSKWKNTGIDYKIENNRLYGWQPAQGAWLDLGAAYADLHSEYAIFSVYLTDIGLSAASTIRFAYEGGDGAVLPQTGTEMLAASAKLNKTKPAGAYRPKEQFGALANPFIGWAPSSRGGNYKQPHTLVTASVRWRDLEPEQGRFDFAAVEQKYDFIPWAEAGSKIVLRIIMDLPTSDPSHLDIPDWLYDSLVKEYGQEGAGTWYDTPSGSGFSPNYESPLLIAAHKRMIEAVAERYDNDPRIAFVQIGSLGHHGEFHSSLIDTPFPPLSVTDQYVAHYLEAFDHVQLGMRKPFPIAAEHRLGLFNDMFGDSDSTETWLNWTRNGWTGIGAYVDEDSEQAALERSRMPEFWQYGYSGGEFSSNRDANEYVSGQLLLQSAEQIRQSHTSWIGSTALLGANGLSAEEQAGTDFLQRLMGYRFVVQEVQHAASWKRGTAMPVTINWANAGVAPFYYPWRVEMALAGSDGKVIASTRTVIQGDLRSWEPGRYELAADLKIPVSLPIGTYRLLTAIIDPRTGEPGVKLAIEGERPGGWYGLDTVQVN